MKKKISLALSVGVLLTTLSPSQVLANEGYSTIATTSSTKLVDNSRTDVEKYIPKIKSMFQIGDEYDNFSVHKFDREDITELSWYGNRSNLSVSIDEDGNVVEYYKYDYSEDRNQKVYKFPKITRQEGEKIAREFIKKVYPDIVDKIEINSDDDIYGIYERYNLDQYTYNFTRTESNIPFKNDTVYIRVNSQNGEVRSFSSYGQKDLKFPSKEGIISKDEAKELYKEKVGLELTYKLRGADNEFQPYLGYSITNTDNTVDAKTKDIVSTSNQYYYPIGRYVLYGNDIENVSNEDETKLINSKAIISRKDASEKIINTFKLGDGYEVSGGQLRKVKEDENYLWEVAITKYEGNGSSGTSVTVDAKTGEIINFSDPGSWREDENGEVKYSKEELLKKAKDFLQKYNPEKYKNVEYVEGNDIYPYSENKRYQFTFIKKSNDIKVESSGFSIGISAVTGNIVEYNYGWNDKELPLPENIIDLDEAKEILWNDKELELQYQSLNQDEKDIKLVYEFKEKHLVIDASTGEIIDSQKEIKDKYSKKEYKDIETSFAKNQINKLQESLVLFEGENFNPKEAISQKDFLSLLSQTKDAYYGWDSEEYLYEELTRENIIRKEEKNPEGKITREEAIKYIVRIFGQEQSGSLGNIYKIDYNDADQISDNLKGHIAIASGLGIISGEGNFRPKDNLRRDEAVVLIYNILNRDSK